MQETQLLHPHHQDRIFVSGTQSLAGNLHALNNFGGYLCGLNAMRNMARDIEERYEILWCLRNVFGLCGIVGERRLS